MYTDHVFCCNCESEMFIPCGSNICPRCGAVGTMMWANEEEPEVEVNETDLEGCLGTDVAYEMLVEDICEKYNFTSVFLENHRAKFLTAEGTPYTLNRTDLPLLLALETNNIDEAQKLLAQKRG